MYVARIHVTLKPTINDPQGITIARALGRLGFETVDAVRAGKYFEITVNETDESAARDQVSEMCEKLLANPVIERFTFDLEPA